MINAMFQINYRYRLTDRQKHKRATSLSYDARKQYARLLRFRIARHALSFAGCVQTDTVVFVRSAPQNIPRFPRNKAL